MSYARFEKGLTLGEILRPNMRASRVSIAFAGLAACVDRSAMARVVQPPNPGIVAASSSVCAAPLQRPAAK